MQSYASQYPAQLQQTFSVQFPSTFCQRKDYVSLVGGLYATYDFNGQVSGYSLFKSGQRKFGEGTYLDKNVNVLDSSYCLHCRRLHPDGLGREPEVRVRQGEEQQREGCYQG